MRRVPAKAPDSEADMILEAAQEDVFSIFDKSAAHQALNKLEQAYDHQAANAYVAVDYDTISKEVSEAKQNSNTGIYGEVLPHGVLHMLSLAVKNNPNLQDKDGHFKPGHFYDLGSGLGRAVMLASLLGFEGDGIELADQRFDIACKSLDHLLKGSLVERDYKDEASIAEKHVSGIANCGSDGMGKAKFTKGSFTDPNVNIADADVVFTDSVFWSDEMLKILGEKASRMKPGSIIFSFKPFPGDSFKSLGEVSLETSWSQAKNFARNQKGTTCSMQQVLANPLNTGAGSGLPM